MRTIKREIKNRAERRLRLKELRNEIAREQQAIKELRGEQQKTNRAAQQLIFTFLQTQQGFAANLFGNLIPGLATAGLVGGAGGTGGRAPSAAAPRPTIRGAEGFGGGLGEALITERAVRDQRAPSQGQLTTLIEVNRQMLDVLKRISGDAKHPEAKRSKVTSGAAMDILAA